MEFYAAQINFPELNFYEYAARTAREYREAKAGVNAFLNLAADIVRLVLFLSDLTRVRKIS